MVDDLSGRELDIAVAKVMGLDVVALDWPCSRDPECGDYEAETYRVHPYGPWTHAVTMDAVYLSEHGSWPPNEEGEAFVEPVPFYSTDPARLVEMLEWLTAHDCDIDVYQRADKHKGCYAWPAESWLEPVARHGEPEDSLHQCVARVVVAVGKAIRSGNE